MLPLAGLFGLLVVGAAALAGLGELSGSGIIEGDEGNDTLTGDDTDARSADTKATTCFPAGTATTCYSAMTMPTHLAAATGMTGFMAGTMGM